MTIEDSNSVKGPLPKILTKTVSLNPSQAYKLGRMIEGMDRQFLLERLSEKDVEDIFYYYVACNDDFTFNLTIALYPSVKSGKKKLNRIFNKIFEGFINENIFNESL